MPLRYSMHFVRLTRTHAIHSTFGYRWRNLYLGVLLAIFAAGCDPTPVETAVRQDVVRGEHPKSGNTVAKAADPEPPSPAQIRETSFSVKEVWRIENLGAPAGLIYDNKSQELRLAQIGGEGDARDGDGVISRVSTDGEILEFDWCRGLNAPKDFALDGESLWVTDIDTVVEVDRATGEIRHKHKAPDARFLVGIARDEEGRLLLADLLASRILSLKDGEFQLLHESPELQSPARFWKITTGLIVAPWGYTDDFTGDHKGTAYSWRPETNAIDLYKMPMAGHWMGLCPDFDGGWFLADFESGTILQVLKNGMYEKVITLDQGLGAIVYLPGERLLIATHITQNRLIAWRLTASFAMHQNHPLRSSNKKMRFGLQDRSHYATVRSAHPSFKKEFASRL